MKAIYLDPKDVPQYLRGSYAGKTFKAIITDSITVPQDAGVWGGGSRESYSFVELATGRSMPSPCQQTAPWDSTRQEFNSPLPVGIAMVEHSMFCGKDMGLTFYVHPDSAAKLLPEPTAELTETHKLVLNATASLKASYNGKDRYEMASERIAELETWTRFFPSREEWETAKAELVTLGYLNKAGAITDKGRNAETSK